MPGGDELEWTFRMRDCQTFKRGFYLLTTLENSWHAKAPLDFSGVTSSIEQIMPQNTRVIVE